MPVLSEDLTPADCISHRGEGCTGAVEYRMPLSGTGRSFPRCDGAWQERLDAEERMIPDTPNPPSWFDPTFAGEHWDDDY